MQRRVIIAALLAAFCAGTLPAAAAARKTTVYACDDQTGFSSTTLTVVINITPPPNMQWVDADSPTIVAQRLLSGLNGNSAGITFKEANGVVPNLYFYVTMSESNSGTRQDSAYVRVTGLAKPGTLFNESSGQAPYTSWRDAMDHLATNMLSWLQNGWHTTGTCRRPDGTIRTSYP